MLEEGQIPDWLRSLRDEQLDEESPVSQPPQAQPPLQPQPQPRPQPRPQPQSQPQPQPGPRETAEDLPARLGQADVMEDLREQMIQAEGSYERAERSPLFQFFLNLEPWKRLILAVLLFLDVALCGCMALVMAGRVVLPF